MKMRIVLAAILLVLPFAPAPGHAEGSGDRAVAELMVAMQLQHIKLWSAGRLGNWPLAAYERDQIEAALQRLPASPAADAGRKAVGQLGDAIGSRDTGKFASAYGELTQSCNACHRAEGRAFITIQVPTSSPFTNQLFVDQLAEARALARSVCGSCHRVTEDATDRPDARIPAPSFADLAHSPAFSVRTLREVLASGHRYLGANRGMPNPRLVPNQIDGMVALFETLRADRTAR